VSVALPRKLVPLKLTVTATYGHDGAGVGVGVDELVGVFDGVIEGVTLGVGVGGGVKSVHNIEILFVEEFEYQTL